MAFAREITEWFRSLTGNDLLLFCTILVTALTAAIVILTVAVVKYARQTLRVTRLSLRFFLRPSVKIVGPQEVRGPFGGELIDGIRKIEPSVEITLHNSSPMEILVPGDGHSFRLLP